MTTYVVLLRGINVGGKNKVPMAELRDCLEGLGLDDVSTYIASGNAIVRSSRSAKKIREDIQRALPERFSLDREVLNVLVLGLAQLRKVVADRPKGFGDRPDTYHSDAIFLIGLTKKEALAVFDPREGVDEIWPGKGVVYSQRLSAERTKSRLGRIAGTPAYESMTIRSWQTTVKLLALAEEADAG